MKQSYDITAHSRFNLSFPHFVKHSVGERQRVKVGSFYNSETKKTEDKYANVMSNGTLDMICHPDKPCEVGDVMNHPEYKGVQFRVTNTFNPRSARGDWSFVDFQPIWMQCEVELVKR